MTATNPKEFIWMERFRPKTVQGVILPQRIKNIFLGFVKKGEIPHMLLSSKTPGTGKTTIARALCHELKCDVLFVNASADNSIDYIRNQIRQFAKTVSLRSGGNKVVIFDECDNLSQDAQKAFRGIMEECSQNARFILTCNNKESIHEAIVSRCVDVEFTIRKDELQSMCAEYFDVVCNILQSEGIEFEPQAVAAVIMKYCPNNRAVMNALQSYATSNDNRIDEGIFAHIAQGDLSSLVDAMKTKNYKDVCLWVENNYSNVGSEFYDKLLDELKLSLEPAHYPGAVVMINENQKHHGKCASQRILVLATVTEIMMQSTFK